jgi:protein SCO1/2
MRFLILIISCVLTALPASVTFSAEEDVFGQLTADFALSDADGAVVMLSGYRGKNVLLAFGFTHCPHICPVIAANMARALNASDKEAVGIFVSVDTERDTPAITHAYSKRFGERMIGLSGSYEQVSVAARNFGVTFVVTKSEDSYTVQHTPSIILIDPPGDIVEVFAINTPVADMTAAMR